MWKIQITKYLFRSLAFIEFPINEALEQQSSYRHQFTYPRHQPFGVAHQIGLHDGLVQKS